MERVAAVAASVALLIAPASAGAATEHPVALALESYLSVGAVGGELVVAASLHNTSTAASRVRLEIALPDATSVFWTSTHGLTCGSDSDSSILAVHVVCSAIDNELVPGEDAWISLRARVLAPGPQRTRVRLTATTSTGTSQQEAEAESIVSGCTITGTDGADVLTGTNGPDVICALAGNDVVRGGGGRDRVWVGRETTFSRAAPVTTASTAARAAIRSTVESATTCSRAACTRTSFSAATGTTPCAAGLQV